MMVECAVLKSETKSKMSIKLYSNIISGATDGRIYARNSPLQQILVLSRTFEESAKVDDH
jgi:hypothetical protein